MKKNIFLIIFTTFLLTLISVAYAAFNSELTISSSGIVEKDTTPPTCGAWYLRDSNLTIQEAYDQDKFINPGTNTTWTTTNKKLFIECSDNMPGDYGCINVTTITDNNNNPRYFKEVKEYTSSIQTDPNAVTVTLKDAYENEKTCTLPVGGSNPYIDKQEPTITITPTSYNKFTYSATDDIGVTGYMVTTTATEPSIDDPNWLNTPAEVTIDNTAAKTYYVWSKDGVNVSYQTIKTFKLTKTQGTGTTLTLKYNNNSGATLSTGYVLDGTKVYVTGSANAGYNTVVLKKDSTTISSGSTQTITAATTISSTATANTYTATFYYNSNTTSGSMTISSVSETCTITGSNTSCNVSIPSAVTDSVGRYNSEYLGVSASLNNLTSAGTTSVSINEDKNFYAFYSSPVTIYYPSATVDGTTGALSNTSVGHYDYYRNEFITNVTSGSEAMSAVLNSTQTATSNFTFTSSATGYALRGFAKVANSTTRTYSSVAVAAASDSSEIYAFIRKGLTATVYYNAGSGDGTLTVATAATATAYRTMYCGTTTTIKMSNANYAIPTAVSTSVGQYETKFLNLSQALNSMTGNRYTSSSSSATGADTKVLYAIYQSNDVEGTTTVVTNYYYNGTSYISRTLYRNSFFTSVTGSGAMTTVLSTSTTGKTNYSTAVGPGNSVWSGLSNAQDTTAEHDSVAAAAISQDLSLYTVYTMNITYEKGSNVSAIEKNSDSCKLTTDSTSCDVTLPTITPNAGYNSVGWSATNGDTTGVTGTYNNTSNTTKLYANAKANTYTIAYAMNNGSDPNPKPTSGTYDSDVVIGSTSMPTKTITITGNANNTGATVGSATINSMTFNGWTTSSSAGLGSGAKTGTEASPSTAWNGSATTNKYFKNLRDTSGTVTLTANWSTSVTLPTLTDPAGYTCKYYTDATAGTEMGSGGATYTVANNSPTSITAFVRCTAKPLVFDDQTITKTFSTSSQSANVTPASNGTGSYTYSKVSGDSDITVSAGGVITIPASKAANTTGYNVVIRATDSNSGATADATYTIKINQAECKLAVSNPANKTPDDTYDLSTLVTANAGTVTYALKSGGSNTTTPSTLSESALTIGAMSSSNDNNQSVDVQFTDPGSNDYEGCTIEKSVTVKKKTNTLAANNSTVYVNSTTALSTFIKNNNGGTVTYTKGTDNTSGSSISGSNFVAGTLAANDDANKTVTITATSARTTKVAASGNVTITVTVQKYTRGLTLTIDPVNVKYNHTANLSTSNTGSGGTPSTTVTYASSNTNVFTVTGSTIKAVSYTGSSDITATRAGSTTVKAATATATATASQSDCLLTVSNSSMTTGSDIDLTTLTSNAVGNVTFAIKTNGTTTASTLSGSTLTAGAMSTSNDNAQTVVVTATEAATDYYTSCSKDITLTVNKQTNTLAANNKTVYVSSSTALSSLIKNNNGGTLSATITTDNTEGSSISGSNLVAGVLAANNDSNKTVVMTVTSARTASVAQKSVTVTATVQKYTRALTITTPSANQEVEYNKTITAASTNGGSGGTPGTVTYSSSNTSVFTVNGTTIKAVGTNGQTATIGASRAGTTTVKAATATAVTVTVIKNQTCQMAVSNPASKNPGNIYDLSALVSGETGTVTYALKSGGNNTTTPSTLSGSTLTIGEMSAENDNDQTVDIQITDAGSDRYVGCTIEKSVTVQKYTRTLAWSSSTPAANASLAYGTSYTATATASGSGGTAGSISYSSNNTTGATINSSTGVITVTGVSQNVTITASLAGTTTVKAASITRAYTTAKGTCPAPTAVAIATDKKVSWTNASGVSSYEISMNASSGFTAHTNGAVYNSITDSTGSRTVYVRSVCDTSSYSSAYSSNASATTTVYSVTLTMGTGISAVSGAGNYITGASASINATVSAGYTWTNWTGSSTITTKSTSVTVNSNKSYTANASPNTYTINYDKNAEDAVGIMAGQIMTYGQSTNLTLNNYSRSGYEFAGWNTNASGTGTNYTDGQSVSNLTTSGTITLYAKWTKKIYTISYTLNGGTVGTANPTVYEIDSPLITLNNPTKTGYTFTGWTEKTTDLDWYNGFINLSTGDIENNSSYPNSYYTDLIYLKAGVTYTISGGPTNLRWRKWNIDGTTYEGNASSQASYTPNTNCYVRILFYNNPTSSQMSNAVITNTAGVTATIPTGSTGNKTFIANYSIDDPVAPTLTGNGTTVYNYTDKTLTCSTTSIYASGTSLYYQFGYSTSTANWTADTITWIGSASTTNTYDVPKNEYIGTRYYGCRVYASDGTSTSENVKVTTAKEQSFVNARVYFNVASNGGTISGSQRLYTPYGLPNIYTGRTNQTDGTIPLATKTGYTFTGWYTAAINGYLVINPSRVVQASVSGWTDASKNWLRNSTSNNDTTNVLYAQFTPNELIFNDTIVNGTYNPTNDQVITNGVNEATNGTGSYTYTITNGNTNNYFELNGRDITIKANTPANTSGYSIEITATDDNSGATKSATYLIKVAKAENPMTVSNITVYAGSTGNNLSTKVSGAVGTVTYSKGTDGTQSGGSSVNASTGSFTAGVLAANDDANKTVIVAVTAAGDSNYESATMNITVTVQKYTRALTITSPTSGQEVQYNTSITATSTNGGSGGTPGAVTYSSSNTNVFTVTGTTIKAVAGSGTATINASRAGSTTVKAATATGVSITAIKATCPAPTNVVIATDKKVSWTNATGASSYQISMNASSGFTAHTNGAVYNSITDSAGTRTVYVRSVCNTNYYEQYSSNASGTTTVYSVVLTKGAGISAVSGEGNYITGSTVSIDATVTSGYTWSKWTKTSGGSTVSSTKAYSGTITSNWAYTATATYTATPTITRNDYNTFTASESSAAYYFISKTQTTKPSASATGWSTTASQDVSTTAKETWYVWIKDSSGNVSSNSATITNYKVSLTAYVGTSISAKADSASGTNVASNTYVLANTPVYPTGVLSTGYNTLVVKKGDTTITNGSSQIITADTTFSSSATPNTYTVNFNKNNSSATGSMSGQIMTYGNTTTLTANAYSLTNYAFSGWNTEPNGTGTSYDDEQSVTNLVTSGTITLYAQWQPAHYRIGTKYYVTLEDALNAASSTGTTIYVIDNHTDTSTVNITSDRITSVSINTNGKTITRNTNQIIIGSGVTLFINGIGSISFTGDASTGGKIINNGTVYLTSATISKVAERVVENNGNFYISSGKIQSTTSYQTVYNNTSGKFYVNGGSLEINCNAFLYAASIIDNYGTLTIQGGSLDNIGTVGYGVKNYGTGVVNMNGGTVTAKNSSLVGIANMSGAATINVTGGTINAEGIGLSNEEVDGAATINLDSGTIIANIGIMYRGGTVNVGKSNVELSTTDPSIQANTGVHEWAGSSTANFYSGEIISDSEANAIIGDYNTRTGYFAHTEYNQSNNTYRTYLKQGLYVSLYPNGGTVSPNHVYALNGRAYGELPTPTKENNIFNGWYLEYSDFEALEYIESDGTQYINTGVPSNTIYGLDFTYMPVGNVSGYDSYLSGTLDNFTLGRYNNNDYAYIRHRTAEVTHGLSVSTTTPNRLEIKNGKAKQGSQSFNVTTTNPISTNNSNLIIGNNSAFNRGSKLRIYGLTLYDANGDVIKKFIPAIDIENTSETYGQVGMYEIVSGTFYPNGGSGEFTASGKRYVTSTTICDELEDHTLKADWTPAITVTFNAAGGTVSPATKQVAVGGKYGELPTPTKTDYLFKGWTIPPASDYIELEYIESTGTQYINTGISTSNTRGVYAKIQNLDFNTTSTYFGAGSASSSNQVYSSNNKYFFDWRTADSTGTTITNQGITEIGFNYKNSRVVTIDGITVKNLGTGVAIASTPIYIFANNKSGTAQNFAKMRLYEMEITNSTSTVHESLIPVRKISTGEVGLYDKKNNVFYGNQGTGEFIAGPAKYITENSDVELTTDHTLVADWRLNSFIVTINAGANTTSCTGSGTYQYGATVTVTCTPASATTSSSYSYTDSTNYGSYRYKYKTTYIPEAPGLTFTKSGNSYVATFTVTDDVTIDVNSYGDKTKTSCGHRESDIQSISYSNFKGCFTTGNGNTCGVNDSNWRTNATYNSWTNYTGQGPQIPVFDNGGTGNQNAVSFRVNESNGSIVLYVDSNDAQLKAHAATFSYSYTLYSTGATTSSTYTKSGRLASSTYSSTNYTVVTKLRWVSSTCPDDLEFDYVGEPQTYTAPSAGTYKLEVCGAQGGTVTNSITTQAGGKGGCASGNVTLSAGEKLYFFVGGQGSMVAGGTPNQGGWNGGGDSGPTSSSDLQINGVYLTSLASGGGATHVSKSNTTIANAGNDLLIVGGGGGGSNAYVSRPDSTSPLTLWFSGLGGAGGGSSGGNGTKDAYDGRSHGTIGYGATQSEGGSLGGSLGQGGVGSSSGGGGGYYGGGASIDYGGAGGGSGYIGGVTSGSWSSTSCANSSGLRTGNGCAKITKQ